MTHGDKETVLNAWAVDINGNVMLCLIVAQALTNKQWTIESCHVSSTHLTKVHNVGRETFLVLDGSQLQ